MEIDFNRIKESDQTIIGEALHNFEIYQKILIVKNKESSKRPYTPRSYKSSVYKALIALELLENGSYKVLKNNRKKKLDKFGIEKIYNKYKVKKFLLENKDLSIAEYDYKTKTLKDQLGN